MSQISNKEQPYSLVYREQGYRSGTIKSLECKVCGFIELTFDLVCESECGGRATPSEGRYTKAAS